MATASPSYANLPQQQQSYDPNDREGNTTPSTSKFTVGSPPSTSSNGGPAGGASTIKGGRRKVATKPVWAHDSDEDFQFSLTSPTHAGPLSRPTSPPSPTQATRPSVTLPPSISSVSNGNHDNPYYPFARASTSSAGSSPLFNRLSKAPTRKESDQSAGSVGWWTFTMPSKYKKKAEEYLRRFQGDSDDSDEERERGDELGNLEKGKRRKSTSSWKPGMPISEEEDRKRMEARLTSSVMSSNHAATPAWGSPWVPFRRMTDPLGSPTFPAHGEEGRGTEKPHTEKHLSRMGAVGDTAHQLRSLLNSRTMTKKAQDFILHSVFAPLVFRIANLSFTAVTLALAVRILVLENRHSVRGIVGSSTILAVIISPLTFVHILGSVYLEYFGRPIGIWSVRLKMWHTLIDLIFIVFWSSELSLSFNDYFTTTLECTKWSPNPDFHLSSGNSDIDLPHDVQDDLCDMQGALVGLVFAGMMLYIVVLVISLFRIFNQVRRKN